MSFRKYPIFHLVFETRHLMSATFLRFQEHYESPVFAGKAFDWETFMDWYAKENGSFSYLDDWAGFNIPSRILRPFRGGAFDPLTSKEQRLLDIFKGVPEPFYVIGTYRDDSDDTAIHEILHGLFGLVEPYRQAVSACLDGFDTRAARNDLADAGYADHVMDDELNAYAIIDRETSGKKGVSLRRLTGPLDEVFKSHFGFSAISAGRTDRILRMVHRVRFKVP